MQYLCRLYLGSFLFLLKGPRKIKEMCKHARWYGIKKYDMRLMLSCCNAGLSVHTPSHQGSRREGEGVYLSAGFSRRICRGG